MNGEQRLTSPELVQELRTALDEQTGWLPALCPNGPGGLSRESPIDAIAERLQAFAQASSMPTAVAPLIQRAAQETASAIGANSNAEYGHLGAAYAYLVQAHGIADSGVTG
ncbi:hypothetical protein [Streptomyces sp. NPDC005231]|uniref:hypothetical protein n=1 Tax=Streptomyces sp. NPDC005231 TaxID=3157026 RepID=UPI00339F9405